VCFRNGPLTNRLATATVRGGTHVGEIIPVRRDYFDGITIKPVTVVYRIADSDLNQAILRERGRLRNCALGLVHVPYAERFVVAHPDDGVFLGAMMGLGFWSKLDPVGQDAAVTFATPAAFNEWVAELRKEEPKAFDRGYSLHPVKATVYESGVWYATVADCQAAGLPGWTPFPLNPL
jgi:hypothetical protein